MQRGEGPCPWPPPHRGPEGCPLSPVATPPANSIQPATLADWRAWLDAHHYRSEGVWLVVHRKTSGRQVFTLDDAIEEALCFGWIDSRPARLDAERTMLWFAPRRPGTGWSKLNKDRVERLIAAGRMTEAGRRKVDAARGDGSWSKLDGVEALEIPSDLRQAFRRHPGARERFSAFPRSVRRGILEWILQARRPETRAKRVEETARLASRNERANQWTRLRSGT